MKTIIVIPTYNEAVNIKKLIHEIFLQNIRNLHIIVVDDSSSDGTGLIVQQMEKQFPITLIQRQNKQGLGSAYVAGFYKAFALGAECIFEMDADFSHDPNDIKKMITEMHNVDLIIGSRKIAGGHIVGWNWIRRCMSNGAMFFARTLLNLQTKDVTSGFRCYRRSALETILSRPISSNGYAFQEEMLYRVEQSGYRVKEIPVTFVDRKDGKSKLSKKDIWEFFIVMIRLKFEQRRHSSLR